MQAKIVFRGNKCFREFDLKTVAEKLGLSIDDFNHFALAVDEKNGKTVYASVYAQVPLFETQCSAINVSGWLFDRVFNLVDAELPNKEHPDITTMVYAGDTWSEPEEWIAQVNTTIRDENDDSRHIIILNDSNVTPHVDARRCHPNSYCSNQRAARKKGQLFHFQKPFYAAC